MQYPYSAPAKLKSERMTKLEKISIEDRLMQNEKRIKMRQVVQRMSHFIKAIIILAIICLMEHLVPSLSEIGFLNWLWANLDCHVFEANKGTCKALLWLL